MSWIAFGAAAIAALAISLGVSLWLEREAQLHEAAATAGKLALALDRHTEATFDLVDSALHATAGELERAARRGDLSDDAIAAILQRNIDARGAIHSLSIRDTHGLLTHFTLLSRPPPLDTSHSDYFQVHRDGTVTGTFIGRPVRSIVTGAWVIPVSRRLNGPHGEFAGVLVVALPISFFGDFFRSLQVGPRGVLSIFRADGTTLVREPEANLIGVRVHGSLLFTRDILRAASGESRAMTASDGIERIFAYRTLPNLPLVVGIGVAVDDVLAAWRARLRLYVALWLVCAVVLAAFTLRMVRQAEREESARAAAADVEARFRRLVDNVPGAVFQRVLRRDGSVGYNFVSGRVEQILGYTPDEIRRDASLINRVDSPAFEAALDDSARELSTLTQDHRLVRGDGMIRWMQTSSTPTLLPNGDVVWDGVAIDITDRKEMELALKKSEAKAEQARMLLIDAIESINSGFVLYDADDRLVVINRRARDWHPAFAAAAVPGARHEDLIRVAAETGLIIGAGADVEEMVEQRLARHRTVFGQPIERRVDGRWFQITEYPTRNGGVVVLRTDVTELKEANVRLEQARSLADAANHAKSEFLAMMSHELRTPLNAILGFAEVIRDHGASLPLLKTSEYAADIHASGMLLLKLVNDVLDLTKAEAGKMELQPVPIDIGDIVGRSLRMVSERAMRQTIELVRDVMPHLPILYADERKLMQILLNLLSNAVKFTPGGGRVTVSAYAESTDVVTITVADTGVGIAAEHLAKALAPFGQVDNLLTRQHPGTGLGLPLAKRLTELHDGTLEVESKVNAGTTVTLRFPVRRPESATA